MKETDCGAVKLEGGRRTAETIRYLVERGIPVMAHIGLTPQSINVLGGWKTQGRTRDRMGRDRGGRQVRRRSRRLRRCPRSAWPNRWPNGSPPQIPIPTIGIGASAACDGQILVMEDMLGLSPRVPKFVKEFGRIGAAIEGAIRSYSEEVRARRFPEPAHTYAMKDEPNAEPASAAPKPPKKAKNPSPREV